MNFVFDKYGNQITSYEYDDWNEYIDTCVLLKCMDKLVFTPIFKGDDHKGGDSKYKENDAKIPMKLILDCLDREDSLETLKMLVPTETHGAYYIRRNIEKRPIKQKIYDCIERHGSVYGKELINDICSLHEPKQSFVGIYVSECLYSIVNKHGNIEKHVDDIAECLIDGFRIFYHLTNSVLALTTNFENNPVKAFLRFKHANEPNVHTSYEILSSVIKIYWIYFFFLSKENTNRFAKSTPFQDMDLSKLVKLTHIDMFPISLSSLQKIHNKYQQQIEQLKEEHQKEIEELLAPEGGAYQAAKERFEKMQKENSDKGGLD